MKIQRYLEKKFGNNRNFVKSTNVIKNNIQNYLTNLYQYTCILFQNH